MSKRSPESISMNRIRLVEVGCIILTLLFTSFFSYKYLIQPNIDPKSQQTKRQIIYDAIKSYAIEGTIIDRDGNAILANASSNHPASVSYPQNYSYAWLLGYYSINEHRQNSYGLRGNLSDYLLYHLDQNNHGATVQLTTNTDLQNFAYDLLNDQEGSITVIDNLTGDILCLASQSTVEFNVNDPDSMLLSDIPGSQYRRGTFETDPPGSTFKVVTAAAALTMQDEENLDDSFFIYNDTGTYTPPGSDFVITNFQNEVFGTIDMNTALAKSCNAYFADLGVRIGAERLEKMMDAFMVGKDINIPFLDTIHSSYNIGKDDNAEIAQTAFGQGNTTITPLHIAMIAQAIANNGDMLQPNIVKKIYSDTYTYYTSKKKSLSQPIDNNIADKLKTYMHSAALEYGLDEYNYGMVYAKTGTAECADDRIHSYVMGFTDRYSFCVSANNNIGSGQLYGTTQRLVNYLNNMN
ncbi:MAG: hypothetical protein MR283_04420 [Erysipelotrichaceae bacterium]|nr:hypothetical protein [Erysipelotrichaceae bacterium]